MSYTSKYTAEQIEDKLTQVFDSTLQTKEIELTSNGTTELTADAEFLGLKSVSVNVNVPQSGGSGSSEEDAFYFVVEDPMIFLELGSLVRYVKCSNFIGYKLIGDALNESYTAGAIFPNDTLVLNQGSVSTGKVVDYLIMMAGDNWKDYLLSGGLTEITKEEFYNLES